MSGADAASSGKSTTPCLNADMPSDELRVAVLFYRIGPYHFARLRTAGTFLKVTAVEFSSVDPVYSWDLVEGREGFDRCLLFQGSPAESQPAGRVFEATFRILDRLRPAAVAIPGWHDRCAIAALQWCGAHHIPAILMSETNAWDEEREPWREFVKSRILRVCSAALVGGQSHADYLVQLGMPRNRIFLGYDVVDNEYFGRKAEDIRGQRSELRGQYGLPEHYFLASARFVEKKNLRRLIQAYARYRQVLKDSGPRAADQGSVVSSSWSVAPWSLVLLGNGPLKTELCRLISDLGLQNCVLMPGFKQYDKLPVYYALASAFIHASTTEQWGLVVNEAIACGLPVLVSNRCGCAEELVRQGQNGFTFDPFDTEQLAQLMVRISTPGSPLESMRLASLDVAAHWGPSVFGQNLAKAASVALNSPRPRTTWLDRAVLYSLVHGIRAFSSIDDRAASGLPGGKPNTHESGPNQHRSPAASVSNRSNKLNP